MHVISGNIIDKISCTTDIQIKDIKSYRHEIPIVVDKDTGEPHFPFVSVLLILPTTGHQQSMAKTEVTLYLTSV